MPNIVQAWLELIGTPERAKRLQEAYAAGWPECPSRALFGAAGSERVYVNPRYTAALDAWDTGMVTRRDILQWAAYVATGTYHGPRFVYQVIHLPPRVSSEASDPASLAAAASPTPTPSAHPA